MWAGLGVVGNSEGRCIRTDRVNYGHYSLEKVLVILILIVKEQQETKKAKKARDEWVARAET